MKKRLNSLDILIIAVFIIAVLLVGYRYRHRLFSLGTDQISRASSLDNYVLTLQVSDIRSSSAQNYLSTHGEDQENETFFLDEGGQLLGTFRKQISNDPAKHEYEQQDGTIVTVSSPTTGDKARVDVLFSLDVSGKMTDDGRFLLNGNMHITPNQSIKIHSKNVSILASVVGIGDEEITPKETEEPEE